MYRKEFNTKKFKGAFYFAYFSFLLLSLAVQDLPFSKYSELFRTPFSFVMFLTIPIYIVFSNGKFYFGKLEYIFLYFILYLLVLNSIFAIYMSIKGSKHFEIDVLLMKSLVNLFYIFLFLVAIKVLKDAMKNLPWKYIYISTLTVFVILNAVFVLEVAYFPNFSLLHASNEPYYRIRLLTHESSWAGSLYTVIFLVLQISYSFYYKTTKSILVKLLNFTSYVSFIVFLTFSGSKGLYGTLIISILIFFLFPPSKRRIKSYITYLLALAVSTPLLLIVLNKLLSNLAIDISMYTSFATRYILTKASLLIFLHHPLGVGTGYFYDILLNNLEYLIKETVGLNTNELLGYFYSFKGLAVKSFFFQGIAWGGIVFIIFFLKLIANIFRTLREANLMDNPIVHILSIYVILSIVFYMDIYIKYQYSLFFAVIELISLRSAHEKSTNYST